MLGLAALGCAALGSLAPSAGVPATKLGMELQSGTNRWNGAAYVSNPLPREQNFIAATGKPFDYGIKIAAQRFDGTVDTSYTGTLTAAVASGTCTLGGTLARACVAGIADFTNLFPATGTGALSIVFTGSGLTSFTTGVMTVVPPIYDLYALDRHGLQIELPRLAVNTTLPSSYAQEYTVNPGLPASSTNVQTWQAAIDKFVADNFATDTRFKITNGSYVEAPILKPKSATTGLCVFEPAGGVARPLSKRISRLDFLGGGVKLNIEAAGGIITCAGAAHHYRFNGLEIQGTTANPATFLDCIVKVANSAFEVVGTDSLADYPRYIGFDRCWIHGGANVDLRRGVSMQARDSFFINSISEDAHCKIGTAWNNGTGDEQAICGWDSPGPVLIDNNELIGAGEPFATGGATPSHYEAIPTDWQVTHNWIHKPQAWAQVYKSKNTTEFKFARRLWFEGNVLENSWDSQGDLSGGQDGTGINLTSNSPGTPDVAYQYDRDIVIRYNFMRNFTAFTSLLTANQPGTSALRRVSYHDNVGVHMNDPVSEIYPGGINRLVIHGDGHPDTVLSKNTLLKSPNAPPTTGLYLIGVPSPTSYIQNNILTCENYGIFGQGGLFGAALAAVQLPDDPTMPGNTLIGRTDGNTPPSGCLDVANNAAVGFTSLARLALFNTLDPDAVCADLTLLPGSSSHNTATDGTDRGANMTAVRAAIAGVWTGSSTAWLVQRRDREPVY